MMIEKQLCCGGLQCMVCTYLNDIQSSSCAMCDSRLSVSMAESPKAYSSTQAYSPPASVLMGCPPTGSYCLPSSEAKFGTKKVLSSDPFFSPDSIFETDIFQLDPFKLDPIKLNPIHNAPIPQKAPIQTSRSSPKSSPHASSRKKPETKQKAADISDWHNSYYDLPSEITSSKKPATSNNKKQGFLWSEQLKAFEALALNKKLKSSPSMTAAPDVMNDAAIAAKLQEEENWKSGAASATAGQVVSHGTTKAQRAKSKYRTEEELNDAYDAKLAARLQDEEFAAIGKADAALASRLQQTDQLVQTNEQLRLALTLSRNNAEQAMIESISGTAWKLVEKILQAAAVLKVDTLGRDEMVSLAERFVGKGREFEENSISTKVTLAYHYTDPTNLNRIREAGLITPSERAAYLRDTRQTSLHQVRGYFGEGIYTANNPISFKKHGSTGLLVAILKGRCARVPPMGMNDNSILDCGIGNKLLAEHRSQPDVTVLPNDETVVRCASQCLPLVYYDASLIEGSDTANQLRDCHLELQRVMNEFFTEELHVVHPKPPPFQCIETLKRFHEEEALILQTSGAGRDLADKIIDAVSLCGLAAYRNRRELTNLVERFILQEREFVKDMRPSTVTLGYHFTNAKVLGDSEDHEQVMFNVGGDFGEGIYTANNPHTFRKCGSTGTLVAILTGNSSRIPPMGMSRFKNFDSGVGNKVATNWTRMSFHPLPDDETVVRCASQYLPLALYDNESLLPGSDLANQLQNCQIELQRVMNECFKDQYKPKAHRKKPNSELRVPFNPAPDMRGLFVSFEYTAPDAFAPVPSEQAANKQQLCFSELHGQKLANVLSDKSDEKCYICHSEFDTTQLAPENTVVQLTKCKHLYHHKCILNALKYSKKCAICREPIQEQQGLSPSGVLEISWINETLAGNKHISAGTFVLLYKMQGGVQKEYHENSGVAFSATSRKAYIPYTQEAWGLVQRLTWAFLHGLIFTIGTSMTSGQPNCITWASIHHKTVHKNGPYGYPDENYFANCNAELDAVGAPSAIKLEKERHLQVRNARKRLAQAAQDF